mgnify:CR=1 FL=1|jgi:hypothetical protein
MTAGLLEFFCGAGTGLVSILIGHPFDYIKTKYQIDQNNEKNKLTTYVK